MQFRNMETDLSNFQEMHEKRQVQHCYFICTYFIHRVYTHLLHTHVTAL